MDTLEKAESMASIRHIVIFLKSRIPIDSFEVPDTTCRKIRRKGEEKKQLQSIMRNSKGKKSSPNVVKSRYQRFIVLSF